MPTCEVFAAAVTQEDQFNLLLEVGDVGNGLGGDHAAAEDTDIGESIEVFGRDGAGLHAAHGEPSHGAMVAVGDGAKVPVDVRDDFLKEHLFKSGEL